MEIEARIIQLFEVFMKRILIICCACAVVSTTLGAGSVPVRAKYGIVASESEIASRIGADASWPRRRGQVPVTPMHEPNHRHAELAADRGDPVLEAWRALLILDADLTTPPEELPKVYNAIVENKAEFVIGSRLVYPMEKQAMRFFNILANKLFAVAFSFVLGQRFKDTLCGTKVLSRAHYQRLAATREFFGDFDPFGDFDLLFGAARLSLRIVEIPVHYRERRYGETNIQRWRHGLILLRMLVFAARRMKFLGHETLHPQ